MVDRLDPVLVVKDGAERRFIATFDDLRRFLVPDGAMPGWDVCRQLQSADTPEKRSAAIEAFLIWGKRTGLLEATVPRGIWERSSR